MITFYLLNCDTCKPRIQKYGPIQAKIRQNNSTNCRPSSTLTCCSSPKEEEAGSLLEYTAKASYEKTQSPSDYSLNMKGNIEDETTQQENELEDEIIDPVGGFDGTTNSFLSSYSSSLSFANHQNNTSIQHENSLPYQQYQRYQRNRHLPYSYTPRNDYLGLRSNSHLYPCSLLSSHPKHYDFYRRSLDNDFAERHGLLNTRSSHRVTVGQDDLIYGQIKYPSFRYDLSTDVKKKTEFYPVKTNRVIYPGGLIKERVLFDDHLNTPTFS